MKKLFSYARNSFVGSKYRQLIKPKGNNNFFAAGNQLIISGHKLFSKRAKLPHNSWWLLMLAAAATTQDKVLQSLQKEESDLHDLTYIDPRLTLIEEVRLKEEFKKPGTIVFLHPFKAAGSGIDKFFKILSFLNKIALETGENFFIPQAKDFPKALRCTIPDKRHINGQLISPNLVQEWWIGGIEIAIEEDWKYGKDLTYYEKNIDVLTGHMPYGIHLCYKGATFKQPVRYMMIFRDPVARLESFIRFEEQRGYLARFNKDQIIEYMKKGNIDNLQTRMAANQMFDTCNEVTIATAKKNIEDFMFAGVAEDVEGLIQALAAIYKLGPVAIPKHQVTKDKNKLKFTLELTHELEDREQCDREIYEWVKKHWFQFKSEVFIKPEIEKDHPVNYLVFFADISKDQLPAYMSAEEIGEYNQAITELYSIPVNIKEFSSAKVFEHIKQRKAAISQASSKGEQSSSCSFFPAPLSNQSSINQDCTNSGIFPNDFKP